MTSITRTLMIAALCACTGALAGCIDTVQEPSPPEPVCITVTPQGAKSAGQCGGWDSRYRWADSLPGFSTTDR